MAYYLAVRRGEGDLEPRADDHHDGRSELDRETTGRCDLRDLHPDSGDDLVPAARENQKKKGKLSVGRGWGG